MRRLWIQRFTWLLWLAMCSTAVLPWAHELAHIAEASPVGAPPAALASQADALATQVLADTYADADTDADSHRDSPHCLVCAHLLGQHLQVLPAVYNTAMAAGSAATAWPSAPLLHSTSPAWLMPPLRGPPSLVI